MRSKATTVEEYLGELPDERRAALEAVRAVILANLPDGVVESMNWGMVSYEVPLSIVPTTYNGQPLVYAGLASQKQHMAVYLMGIYGDDALRQQFEDDYRATGKRMDVGKSCVRFKRLDDLPLDVIGRAIGAMRLEQFVALHTAAASMRASRRQRDH